MDSEQEKLLWHAPIVLHLVTISERSPSKNIPAQHRHLFCELGLVLSGSCEWHLGQTRICLTAGDAVLVPPGQEHAENTIGEIPACIGWVGFDAHRAMPSWVNQRIGLRNDFKEIVQTYRSIEREHGLHTSFSTERIQFLLQNLLLLVHRQANGSEPQRPPTSALNARQAISMESAAHYFRQNFADCLSIPQVAAYHSLSPTYFSSLFQQHHGVSPRTYIHHVRMEHAAGLLATSPMSIKEVARQCGFFDSAHFCKAFRKHLGQSPSDFRAQAS